MFSSNPFALLTEFLPPLFMQVYVGAMILAVILGVLLDLHHKGSAEYFARRRRQSRAAALRQLGTGATLALALRTLGGEVATSGEFGNGARRYSHLLMSWGFVTYLSATVAMVFAYPGTPAAPILLTALWNIGALMVLAGGLWFFFRLRVNVAYEGHSPFHLMRADLFIGSLLASVALGLAWHFAQTAGAGATATLALFGLYLFFTTLLFVSVPWSKFAHMFYKPAAAFQRRVEEANGSSDLPQPSARSHISDQPPCPPSPT
jgi:hypothetical protein